jgi:5-methylcytosine-specific restriction endonuclease McrA
MGSAAVILFLIFLLGFAVIIAAFFFVASRHNGQKYENLTCEIAEEKKAKRETARRRYVTKAMKQHVLERDNYTCQICGISKGYLDDLVPGLGDFLLLEIDHIVPVAKGGSGDDESNLQTLCWRCNRKKGKNRTNDEVRAMIDYELDCLEREASDDRR